MINFSNHFSKKLSIQELEAFEAVNKIQLPEDYRNFLLQYNGGKPSLDLLPQKDTNIAYFLGMHNDNYYSSIYWHIETFSKRLPLSTFPIARDYFGNLFIISIHPESYGHIYYWDHENEPETQDGHNTQNCSFIAYCFTELLNSLT